MDRRPQPPRWCATDAGLAIDPSPNWTEPGRPLRDCYFGVALPLDLARRYAEGEGLTKGVLYELTGRMDQVAAALRRTPAPE